MKHQRHRGATRASRWAHLTLLGIAAGTCALPATAQTTSLVHDFGSTADGSQPFMQMTTAADGTLYGSTTAGGSHNYGTIFKITSTGQFQTIYNFGDLAGDGYYPIGRLALGPDGSIYGTTRSGGSASAGTVFKVTPAGVETLLYSFGSVAKDATSPYGGLVYVPAAASFFGATYTGGTNNYGAIFKVSTTGVEKAIYSFSSTTGNYPQSPLVLNPADGFLYGTTTSGGTTSQGTVFKVSTAGVLTTISSLSNSTGIYPSYAGLVVATNGKLYGCTRSGGTYGYGTIYTVAAGVLTTIYSFPGGSIGGSPQVTLTAGADGNLYGSEISGPQGNNGLGNLGGIFKVTLGTPVTVAPLYNFMGSTDGSAPGWLTQGTDGYLYGGTSAGGRFGWGSIFKIGTGGDFAVIQDLNQGFHDGVASQSKLLLASDGNFYGTTKNGGYAGQGTIFQLTPQGALTIIYNFGLDASAGTNPYGGVVQTSDGSFYGTTAYGGSSNNGTVYKFTVSGSPARASVTPLAQFDSVHGQNPRGTLLRGADGNLYGVTYAGGSGTGAAGTVFKMTPAGVLTVLKTFLPATGSYPLCTLVQGADGSIYGTTSAGNTSNLGAVFKMSTTGVTAWIKPLTSATTYSPQEGVVFGPDGNLYGTGYSGGVGYGGIFKVTTAGVVTNAVSFDGTAGDRPVAPLVLAPDGKMYGSNYYDLATGKGTLFQYDGVNVSLLATFNNTLGINPVAALTLGPDGNFYGMTTAGGKAGGGTAFKLDVDIPAITGFSPATAATGATVAIVGSNFTGATGVTINGKAATFTVVDDNNINAVVPAGGTLTGNIVVTTPVAVASKGVFTFIPPPTITSFTPTSGKTGDTITITGTVFTGATAVTFTGGASATSYIVKSATQITAVVPAEATTGKIMVTTPGGTATSAASFTFYPTPSITSFTPTSAGAGGVVTITGENFTGATAVTFNTVAATSFTVGSATTITAVVPNNAAATGLISVTTKGGIAKSPSGFAFIAAPKITSFTPATGPVGTFVTITGTGFTGATSVKFNVTGATSYTVNSATSISANVPSGATTGTIKVTTPAGMATSATNFTVTAAVAPTISGFTPATGPVGTQVVITGTNLAGATAVLFNGTPATYAVNAATQITASVPAGATTGTVKVTTPGGTATSVATFTVAASTAPTITTFTPATAPSGTAVIINGTNLTNIISVRFNTLAASYTPISATQIVAVVPSGAATGKIAIKTSSGTATSAASFTVTAAPTITSFSPPSGKVGSLVIVNGTNFTGATAVTLNGVDANFTVGKATQLTLTVPSGATTGPIVVSNAAGDATSATNYTVTP